MVNLSVIIVNYNVKVFLEQALHSILKALEGISSEVFVVDNASRDGSVALIKKKFPDIKLIENKKNVGFARANNQALQKAGGNVVCLINPDTLVSEDTFRICLDYLKTHKDVGMVGCKILNPDGTLQLACRRSFPTPWVAFSKVVGLNDLFPKSKLFGKYNLTYLDPEKTTEVDAISGSFMMIQKRAIDDIGLLDETFFLYGEDLDWCYRMGQAGWKIVYLPKTQDTKCTMCMIHRSFTIKGKAPEKRHLIICMFFTPLWVCLSTSILTAAGMFCQDGSSFLESGFEEEFPI